MTKEKKKYSKDRKELYKVWSESMLCLCLFLCIRKLRKKIRITKAIFFFEDSLKPFRYNGTLVCSLMKVGIGYFCFYIKHNKLWEPHQMSTFYKEVSKIII